MHATERLRKTLALCGNTRDADRWTAEEWIKLSMAYGEASHDFTPDDWTETQVSEALQASPLAPRWEEDAEGTAQPVAGKPFVRA
jgi:hypothetical protein